MEFTLLSLFLHFCFAFFTSVVFLAAIGKSVGARAAYVKILCYFFKWGKEKIEHHNLKKSRNSTESDNTEVTLVTPELTADNGDGFHLADIMYFTASGMQRIVNDDLTRSFDAAELPSWNLLTRTNQGFQYISVRLTIAYFIGWFTRWFILFPFRFVLACIAIGTMFMGTLVIGYLPDGRMKSRIHSHFSQTCYRIMTRAFSGLVRFHNRENRAKGGGICVANHTSPIDIIILGGDNCYSMVGQMQGGLFGTMQHAFSRAETHIWFQRSESKDRKLVRRRLQEHASNPNLPPLLIFPEGMCVNNESILQFKKGSFEVGVPIYPIALKYNPIFADPFWGAHQNNLVHHFAAIMTSWALVLDIWYLPPTTIQENETAIEFAERVKTLIAKQTGMANLEWDAALKYSAPKPEMKHKQQQKYTELKKLNKGSQDVKNDVVSEISDMNRLVHTDTQAGFQSDAQSSAHKDVTNSVMPSISDEITMELLGVEDTAKTD